jgi:MOSC domain-containing protein YiiM
MTEVENSRVVPRVIAVNRSAQKGVPKIPIPAGLFIENFGLQDDAHAGSWHRQVSLLGQESIDRMTLHGVGELAPGSFAENITTENIILYDLQIGDRLFIGQAVFEVTQIGKECHRKCAIYHQIGDCIMPNEGIFVRVLQGGIISPGDEITLNHGDP